MSSHPLYKTSRWLRLRLAQLATEPLCRFCEQVGRVTPATIADHVEPHRGDAVAFFENELQSLCKPCHDRHKQAVERGSGLVGSDANGYPVDPSHPWS